MIGIADHGESDKLVQLYTQERGRIRGLAKGARRSARRFVNKLEEFTLLRLHHRAERSHGLLLITEAELLEPHLQLRLHYDRFLPGMLLCELTRRCTMEEDSDPRLFQLLRWSLGQLSTGPAPLQTALLFHLRFLELAGYRPELERCGHCGSILDKTSTGGFDPVAGTVSCESCASQSRNRMVPISLQTLRLLRDGLRLAPSHLQRLRFSHAALTESMKLLCAMSRHLLHDELRCLRLLREQLSQDNESRRHIR